MPAQEAPKQLGQAARDSEQQFRTLADNAPVMIWRSGPDRLYDWFNKSWLEFTGRSMAQELGNGWIEGVHPDDLERCLQTFVTAFDARRPFSTDFRLRRHDGVYRWLLDSGRPFHGADGTFAGYFGSCIDISDRKEAEVALRQALEEKNALLHELHHRVKNNMQLIVSLLRLQGKRVADEDVRRLFEESASRVHSVALLQSELYDSAELSRIEMARYLRKLTEAAPLTHRRPEASVRFEAEPLEVPVQRAAPLGLIANELLSNALLHGLPPDGRGEVRVRLSRHGHEAELAVEDDGPGLPPGAYPSGGSFGFQLIAGLAGQAGATVSLAPGPGTRFHIRFPA